MLLLNDQYISEAAHMLLTKNQLSKSYNHEELDVKMVKVYGNLLFDSLTLFYLSNIIFIIEKR